MIQNLNQKKDNGKKDASFDKKNRLFSTLVYRRIEAPNNKNDKTKKPKREELPVHNVKDLKDKMPFQSEVRFLIVVNKLWAKTKPDKYGKYEYGPAVKILYIEVIPSIMSGTSQKVSEKNVISSDEDDDDNEKN